MTQRQAVTKKKALAYRSAGRAGKGRILTELVELTGWHRDYARAALTLKAVEPRAGRAPTYGPVVTKTLVKCWAVLRAPAAKRLAPMLGVLVPLLCRDDELRLTDAEATLLVRMSAATIDRRLAPETARLISRGRSHTKPGTLLKSQIPIRTWADWDDAVPGFVESDLVGHEGGNPSGKHCFTLTVTDIATEWTVNRSVRNKAEKWVFEPLMHVRGVFPFPIIGIDFRQRIRVHQPPPLRLLRGQQDHFHPVPRQSQQRRRILAQSSILITLHTGWWPCFRPALMALFSVGVNSRNCPTMPVTASPISRNG